MSSYQHDPFKATKRRSPKKVIVKLSCKRRRAKGLSSKKENLIGTNTILASHRKIICDPSSSSNSDIPSNEEESFDALQYWIVDINKIVVNTLQNVCVCIKCHISFELVALVNFRAGLVTHFSLRCLNPNCDLEESFYSTDKTECMMSAKNGFWH